MKNLILAFALLVFSIATQAHNIDDNGCSNNGFIYVKGTAFDFKNGNNSDSKSDSVVLYITTNNNANGPIKWKGYAFVQSNGTFNVQVPYYDKNGVNVFFIEYERNNKTSPYHQQYTSNGSTLIKDKNCSVTPITLTSWTAQVDATDSQLVHFKWSVEMEQDVAYYRIDGSTDNGKTWDTAIVTKASLGNTNIPRSYAVEYYNPLIGLIAKTAGFGGVATLVLIAVFAGSIRNRAMAGIVACTLFVATVACTKHTDAPHQSLKYNAFKLTEVDNNGMYKDFEVRLIKVK